MKCGDRIWVLERDLNEKPYGVAVTGYIFLAQVGSYVLATEMPDDFIALREVLDVHTTATKTNGCAELLVFPAKDCFTSQEDACAMLPQE